MSIPHLIALEDRRPHPGRSRPRIDRRTHPGPPGAEIIYRLRPTASHDTTHQQHHPQPHQSKPPSPSSTPTGRSAQILAKDDDLTDWLKDNRNALRLDDDVDQKLVERVTQSGYAPDLNDEEVERLGCDPFLIAYALGDPAQRAVVTTEVSRPSRKRANRHIPDVCRHLKVDCYNTFQFIKALNFTTGWQRSS